MPWLSKMLPSYFGATYFIKRSPNFYFLNVSKMLSLLDFAIMLLFLHLCTCSENAFINEISFTLKQQHLISASFSGVLSLTFELNGAAMFAASEQGGFMPCVFECLVMCFHGLGVLQQLRK